MITKCLNAPINDKCLQLYVSINLFIYLQIYTTITKYLFVYVSIHQCCYPFTCNLLAISMSLIIHSSFRLYNNYPSINLFITDQSEERVSIVSHSHKLSFQPLEQVHLWINNTGSERLNGLNEGSEI